MANPNIVNVTTILGGNLGWNLSASATDKLYFTYANGYTAPANNNNTDMNIFKVA